MPILDSSVYGRPERPPWYKRLMGATLDQLQGVEAPPDYWPQAEVPYVNPVELARRPVESLGGIGSGGQNQGQPIQLNPPPSQQQTPGPQERILLEKLEQGPPQRPDFPLWKRLVAGGIGAFAGAARAPGNVDIPRTGIGFTNPAPLFAPDYQAKVKDYEQGLKVAQMGAEAEGAREGRGLKRLETEASIKRSEAAAAASRASEQRSLRPEKEPERIEVDPERATALGVVADEQGRCFISVGALPQWIASQRPETLTSAEQEIKVLADGFMAQGLSEEDAHNKAYQLKLADFKADIDRKKAAAGASGALAAERRRGPQVAQPKPESFLAVQDQKRAALTKAKEALTAEMNKMYENWGFRGEPETDEQRQHLAEVKARYDANVAQIQKYYREAIAALGAGGAGGIPPIAPIPGVGGAVIPPGTVQPPEELPAEARATLSRDNHTKFANGQVWTLDEAGNPKRVR